MKTKSTPSVRQPVLAADARDQRIDEGHIHRIRRMAAQTQQHRPVAGVPPTRGAQRAIQRAGAGIQLNGPQQHIGGRGREGLGAKAKQGQC